MAGSPWVPRSSGGDDEAKTENSKPSPRRWVLQTLCFCRLLSPALPALCPCRPLPWIPPSKLPLLCPPAHPTPACFLPWLWPTFPALSLGGGQGRLPAPFGGQGWAGSHPSHVLPLVPAAAQGGWNGGQGGRSGGQAQSQPLVCYFLGQGSAVSGDRSAVTLLLPGSTIVITPFYRPRN